MMIEDMPIDDSWVAGEFSTEDNLPVLVRIRPQLQNFMDSGLFNYRLDIIWPYESFDDSLLPDGTDLDVMEQVEDALIDAFEQDNQTILAFVITAEGERWWAWYTTDIDIAGERLNRALSNFDRLPITINGEGDAAWDEYVGVLEDFGE